jgi:hypothetical protein
MRNILISFSFGESSAFMTIKLWERYKNRNDVNVLVCFANTGKEREETLEFGKRVQEHYDIPVFWLEAYVSPVMGKGVMPVIVDFDTASRDGKPMFDQAEKLGNCGISTTHCTRDLKTRTIMKFAKAYFNGEPYENLQGIRFDEQSRIDWESAKEKNWDYPLASDKELISYKSGIRTFWRRHKKQHGWRLDLKPYEGNCDLCFKKSDRKLIQSIRDRPCSVIAWKTMELISSTDEFDMYRQHRTIDDLLELAKEDIPPDLFSDFGGACLCS